VDNLAKLKRVFDKVEKFFSFYSFNWVSLDRPDHQDSINFFKLKPLLVAILNYKIYMVKVDFPLVFKLWFGKDILNLDEAIWLNLDTFFGSAVAQYKA